MAGSIALVAFGIDSAIESFSGTVLVWRLHGERNGQNVERLEKRALKLVVLLNSAAGWWWADQFLRWQWFPSLRTKDEKPCKASVAPTSD